MYRDLKAFLRTYHECQVCDKTEKKFLFSWVITVNHLFQRYTLDYIEPLTESEYKNVYILIITEY